MGWSLWYPFYMAVGQLNRPHRLRRPPGRRFLFLVVFGAVWPGMALAKGPHPLRQPLCGLLLVEPEFVHQVRPSSVHVGGSRLAQVIQVVENLSAFLVVHFGAPFLCGGGAPLSYRDYMLRQVT